jgi:hypothetical protein
MPYQFNIVCSSLDSISGITADKNSVVYGFNFLNMKQGKYIIKFSFCSTNLTTYTNSSEYYICIPDLGINQNIFSANNKCESQNSSIIGFLKPNVANTSGYVSSDWSQNPEFFISNLPVSSQYTVEIRNISNGLLTEDFGVNSNYILILNFSLID